MEIVLWIDLCFFYVKNKIEEIKQTILRLKTKIHRNKNSMWNNKKNSYNYKTSFYTIIEQVIVQYYKVKLQLNLIQTDRLVLGVITFIKIFFMTERTFTLWDHPESWHDPVK